MTLRRLIRSMPVRLTLALVILFTVTSLIGLGLSYAVSTRSLERTMREDLNQDIAGFRAAPSLGALIRMVDAEARVTDPQRRLLSYLGPNGRQYGNSAILRSEEGYRFVTIDDNPGRAVTGDFMTLTVPLRGGFLTIARNLEDQARLAQVFRTLLLLGVLPTAMMALAGGAWLARRNARRVARIESVLHQLTTGTLAARVDALPGPQDDIWRIAERVDRMAAAREAAFESLRQVSADIAHDLKTPIQRVAVHLAALDEGTTLDTSAQDRLTQAREEIATIVSVFQGLLQIAQIDSGSPRARFAPVDLAALIRDMADLYGPAAQEQGRQLTLDIAPDADRARIPGARDLLGQALANLIENALRHSPTGDIALSLDTSDDALTLTVADRGPGIPAPERDKVLHRLYRLERSRHTPGSGLGLSLVAGIADLHDATLTLGDNQPGLKVTLRFPKT